MELETTNNQHFLPASDLNNHPLYLQACICICICVQAYSVSYTVSIYPIYAHTFCSDLTYHQVRCIQDNVQLVRHKKTTSVLELGGEGRYKVCPFCMNKEERTAENDGEQQGTTRAGRCLTKLGKSTQTWLLL